MRARMLRVLVSMGCLALASAGAHATLRVEANRGQADAAWAFVVRAGGERLPLASSKGLEPLPGKVHYLGGTDPKAWIVDVPTYGAVLDLERIGAPAGIPALGPVLARDAAGNLYLAGQADDTTTFLTQLDPSGSIVLRTTYLDGFSPDAPLALAVTPAGEAVLVGSGGGDAVVVRVAADGRSLVSRATFGGSGADAALAAALDADGNAWVAGRTASADLRAEGALAGAADAFLAQVEPAGSVLFATYLGGAEADEARGLALDKEGAVYLTGRFGADAFLAKLVPKSSTLVFATHFGGSRDDVGVAVAVSPSGDVMIAGTTRSADLPILRGAQGALGGESDAFLATFEPASGALLFSTYAGNAEKEDALALAVDRRGAIWVAGSRGADAFVSRIDPERTELLAGEAEDVASGLVVDGNGDAWVAGLTRSQELPAVSRPESVGGGDVFLARLPNDDPTPKGACPGTKNFTGASSLAWGTAANWSGGTLPVATDDVCISGFNVTVASGAQVAGTLRVESGALTVSGGTLTIAGASEINGPLTLSSPGTLTGAGNLTVSGLFTWTGGTLSGTGSVTTNGTVSMGGNSAKQLSGRTWTTNAAVTWVTIGSVVMSAGAVINNASTWDCQGFATMQGGTFNNSGTFKKTAGGGPTTVSTGFVNTGSVLVQADSFEFGAGSSTGSFDVSAGATLRFTSGVFGLNAGTTFTGSGTVSPAAAGTLSIDAPITIPATLTVSQTGGTISGLGTLTIQGTFNWSAGTMQLAGVTTCSGPANISGAGVKQVQTRTLNLDGGAVLTGVGITAGSGAVINSPGTFDCQSDATFSSGGGAMAVFNNSGTFKKSAGTGTTSINYGFSNSSSVLVQSGTLSMAGTATSAGNFDVSAGRTLQVVGGGLTLNSGTTFTGTGNVALSNGLLTVAGSVAMPAALTFSMSGGTLGGTGTLTLAGPFNWSGGSVSSLGTTTCNGDLNVSGAAALLLQQRVLNANGTTTYTGTGNLTIASGAVLNNNGTWDAQSDLTILSGGSGGTFKNFATFRKSAGAGTMSVQTPFTNSGTVDVQSGTLSAASYTQTAGTTKLTGGAFTSAAAMAIQGGTLAGSGSVSGPVVVSGTGALAPGLSAGTLSVGGNYTQQAPSGGFNVEIGGMTPGTQHDRVDVTGAATLAGVLNVSLIGGFVPAPGNSFTILTYASRTGTFTVNPPAVPCISWQVNYGATALVLTAAAAPAPVEIAQLASPSKTTLTWAAGSAAGIVYDVLRGSLSTLPVGPGAGETCLATGIAGTTQADPTTPALGTGYWYVVRGRVPACGAGSYGFATGGIERISTACP